ncbi:MAG TPA: hypothetical protein VLK27_00640 [Chthoniobacterales bacterium]|nr:hypothetical protein [Chthoniobacterales bacterium]
MLSSRRFAASLAVLSVFGLVIHTEASQPTARRDETGPIFATEADWKANFSYWPMPFIEPALVDPRYRLMQVPQPLGLYRLSLDASGVVTEITIRRKMGPPFDATALKTLINWKAKASTPRMVTIFLRYGQKHRVATATIREWGFAPGKL